jgi:ABC-2 type transport system permease protein
MLVAELVVGIRFYHMTFSGSYLDMFVVCSLGYITLVALGQLLSNLVNTVQEASVVTQLLFFILIFLSGTTMPLDGLPESLQRIALFTPPTLMIILIQGVILGGDLTRHLLEIDALVSCCVTAVIIAVLVFRWDKSEKVTRRKRLQAVLAVVPLLAVGILLNSEFHFRPRIPAAKEIVAPVKPF